MSGPHSRRSKAGLARRSCAAVGLAVVAAGCGVEAGSPPMLTAVSPVQAYNDKPFSLEILGGPFRPAYEIDTQSGRAAILDEGFSAVLSASAGEPGDPPVAIAAQGVAWQSRGTLLAALPAGIPAGTYDLTLEDPRGLTTAPLARAFVSLGPDTSPPVVALETPGPTEIVGAGSTIQVTARASDGQGQLASIDWRVSSSAGEVASGSCKVPAGARNTRCAFTFSAPIPAGPTDALVIEVEAFDLAGASGSDRRAYLLARAPEVSAVRPRTGPTAGGTVVEVEGTNFHRATASAAGTEILFDGVPATEVEVNPQGNLVGVVPSHPPGLVNLIVRNQGAETHAGGFEYLPPAVVRMVSPAAGAPAGGTPVAIAGHDFRASETVVFFGSVPLLCPRYVSSRRIEGIVPPGSGTVSVTARNPIGGSGDPLVSYRYDPNLAGAGGPGCPTGAMTESMTGSMTAAMAGR